MIKTKRLECNNCTEYDMYSGNCMFDKRKPMKIFIEDIDISFDEITKLNSIIPDFIGSSMIITYCATNDDMSMKSTIKIPYDENITIKQIANKIASIYK